MVLKSAGLTRRLLVRAFPAETDFLLEVAAILTLCDNDCSRGVAHLGKRADQLVRFGF